MAPAIAFWPLAASWRHFGRTTLDKLSINLFAL
jgi:hypothetical protein